MVINTMRKEIEVSGKTVDDCISKGAAMLGVDARLLTYEVICAPKKGFLGFGETPATVKVFYEAGSEITALEFVKGLLEKMGLDCTAAVRDLPGKDAGKLIDISGSDAGVLIGHHGETLDALQYLTNLAANKREEEEESRDYCRITVDVENYREKREETLRSLARRMASRVLKYKKSLTLEPMNPYERRIIHSEIQKIDGVSTNSIGADNNRRVVIFLTDRPQTMNGREEGDMHTVLANRGSRRRRGNGRSGRPVAAARESVPENDQQALEALNASAQTDVSE